MQGCAADSIGHAVRKNGFGFFLIADEANAAQGMDVGGGNLNPELTQSVEAIRHQALTAGLIDRRNCAIGHDNAQPPAARGDCGCEASGASAHYENIGRILQIYRHESHCGSDATGAKALAIEDG
jgi:hypothetical protein